ncbi:MAG: hypothetical protein U0836_21185 [Pirellulales bacterium]
MNRFSVVLLVCCGLVAAPALAQVGGLPLELEIDPLGMTSLKNLTGDVVSFDAYQITSADGLLSPTGWQSIADQAALDPAKVTAELGAGALLFGEANPTGKSLAELNVGNAASLAANARFGIGSPFSRPVTPTDDVRFFFKLAGEASAMEGPLSYFRPPLGDLRLLVGWDGSAWLWNTTASPLSFDGYQIASETQILNPQGWKSIADYVSGGEVAAVIQALGAGGLTFGEANPNAGSLAELSLSGVATLQGGAQFYIGHPFRNPFEARQAQFFYKIAGTQNSTAGTIDFVGIPEPGGLTLLVCGLAALFVARRGAFGAGRGQTRRARDPATYE